MPAGGMAWIEDARLMRTDEIVRLARLMVGLGVHDVRITGGEPLARRDLVDVVGALAALPGVAEVSMTTNGVLLADHADNLVAAGLGRVNVSMDSLDPVRFHRITRRDDLERALSGLAALERHPRLGPIKVNAVLVRGLSEDDVLPLADLARARPYVVRFIEAMPIDAGREWRRDDVIAGAEVRAMIARRWPLEPMTRERPSAPAERWRFADGAGEVQFVSSVTAPFCAACDRLRLTADGRLRTCLFSETETDMLGPLRAGADDEELAAIARTAVAAKPPGHGIGREGWSYGGRPMSMIGG